MNGLVIAVFLFLAVFLGTVAGLLGGVVAVVLFIPILPLIFLLRDYRVGAVCLMFILPFVSSPLLPQTHGFNVYTYLLAGTFFAFLFQQAFQKSHAMLLPPKPVFWTYLLPVSVALILALPHLGQGAFNFSMVENAFSFAPADFVIGRYIKPIGFVVTAFLLANALRQSRRPERFLIPFALSAIVPAVAVCVVAILSRGSLDQLQGNRLFLSGLGRHANELGLMLLLAVGPLLFMAGNLQTTASKIACRAILALLCVALVLTFSRGAFVGLMVVITSFLVSRRRIRLVILFGLIGVMAVFFAPNAIKDRLTVGLDADSLSRISGNMSDKLTAGRIASWQLLAPDVLKSPVWGSGLGSTAWTNAVNQGRYAASHPHNLYLEILLDMGVAGFACLMLFYWKVMRLFRGLAKAQTLSPVMQGFFEGSAASFAGLLVMGFVSFGHYMPEPEQAYFWLALGMALAYWKEVFPEAAKCIAGNRPGNKLAISRTSPASMRQGAGCTLT